MINGIAYMPVSVTFGKNNPEWRYNMFWYKNNPYYFYPNVFVSPFVTGTETIRNQISGSDQEADFPDAKFIVADSGGFQITSHRPGISFSALDILNWQENKIQADVAFTLDVPVYSYRTEVKGQRYYTDGHFEKCLAQSLKNNDIMLSAKKRKETELWAVLQGGNYKDLDVWYKAVTREHEFKGYCFPTGSSFAPKQKEDMFGQIQFAKDVGTNFHFLGRCEPILVLILAKLSQITGKLYTYDTASAATALMLGKYHEPRFLSSLSFSNIPERRVHFPPDSHPPCPCPICQKHTCEEMWNNAYLIFLHNVWVRVDLNDYIYRMARDDDVFNELVNKYLALHSVYRKNSKEIKDKINSVLYGEKRRYSLLKDFVKNDI